MNKCLRCSVNVIIPTSTTITIITISTLVSSSSPLITLLYELQTPSSSISISSVFL